MDPSLSVPRLAETRRRQEIDEEEAQFLATEQAEQAGTPRRVPSSTTRDTCRKRVG